MQIILLARLQNKGEMGDVVTVKDGFARNFLLPTHKAIRATEANRRAFEAQRRELEEQNRRYLLEAQITAARLAGGVFPVLRAAGAGGVIYGSVSTRDIADTLSSAGFVVSRNQVVLDKPIKSVGIHVVKIALHPELVVAVTINVARSLDEAGRNIGHSDSHNQDDAPAGSNEAIFEESAAVPTVSERLAEVSRDSSQASPDCRVLLGTALRAAASRRWNAPTNASLDVLTDQVRKAAPKALASTDRNLWSEFAVPLREIWGQYAASQPAQRVHLSALISSVGEHLVASEDNDRQARAMSLVARMSGLSGIARLAIENQRDDSTLVVGCEYRCVCEYTGMLGDELRIDDYQPPQLLSVELRASKNIHIRLDGSSDAQSSVVAACASRFGFEICAHATGDGFLIAQFISGSRCIAKASSLFTVSAGQSINEFEVRRDAR